MIVRRPSSGGPRTIRSGCTLTFSVVSRCPTYPVVVPSATAGAAGGSGGSAGPSIISGRARRSTRNRMAGMNATNISGRTTTLVMMRANDTAATTAATTVNTRDMA
ncbi:hypothetical protein [Actinophytocola sp. NPDC049390]|uniref:hypothetical protein n=1 Tax=Actinophytocola sp. NPDC049390 TaxID=3363894 RepID=UPI00378DF5FC